MTSGVKGSCDREHGTLSMYVLGCRCDECRDANRKYHADYRARIREREAYAS